jgi:hypothetical protein
MKILKLMLVLGSVLIANAIYATDVSVTRASLNGASNGTTYVRVDGSNGEFYEDNLGNNGTVTPVSAVTHVTSAMILSETNNGSSGSASCTLVVPTGVTATLNYVAARTNISVATASATINSSTYTATYTTPATGTIVLAAGTYNLSVSSSCGTGNGGPVGLIWVTITYP